MMNIWKCKIGGVDAGLLPNGADFPMRQAVEEAYQRLTGQESHFIFSGWGAELTERERAVVENRMPREQESELDHLRSRNEKLEVALRFYAERHHYSTNPDGSVRGVEDGDVARKAIATSPPDSEPIHVDARQQEQDDAALDREHEKSMRGSLNADAHPSPDSEPAEGAREPLLREPTDEERAKGIGAVTTRGADADELNEAIARGEPAEGAGEDWDDAAADTAGTINRLEVAGEVYQAVGVLLSDAERFDDPDGIALLDACSYLAGNRDEPPESLLPFASSEPAQRQDAMVQSRVALDKLYQAAKDTNDGLWPGEAMDAKALILRHLFRTSDEGGVAESKDG